MVDMRFDEKVAVVTGAGNGLGRAYALALAERGAKVLVNDLGGSIHGGGADESPAKKTTAEIVDAGGVAEANFDSVATGSGGSAIIAQALATWGHVDVVVNNAGAVVARGPIDENTDEQYVADLMVAAGGAFFVAKAAWKHMWDRDFGRILNVSSSAFLGMNSSAGYPAAKGATWGLTRNLAYRAAAGGKNIKVNCVMPTAAARMTGLMGDTISAGMDKYYPPEAAAAAAAFLVHDDVPVSGEMFAIGGDHMRRVFVGIATGFQAGQGELSMELLRDNFDDVMDTSSYIIARNALDKVLLDSRVPWEDGRGSVF